MTVKPGYGNEKLHLRESGRRLRETFGSPASRSRVTSFREYWLYPERNFGCLVSKKTGNVLSIFLHRRNPIGADDLFGLNESEIRSHFPNPDSEGGGTHTEAGFMGRWLSYNDGIGFHFDRHGRVETVSLYARKRVPKLHASVKNNALTLAALAR